ncbi:Carboxypeptidase S1-like protein A [Lasiodiplodia hormozganensis]|uniref:Carboxypeptidase n=1 Tax=Lasiodiplodia hormozganensis TaxID=869390 RepID=A0AA40CPR7_9PEZI|nr:Carboxypeptidase S1-like protein A [Lasiodiplodia hormozganensis]
MLRTLLLVAFHSLVAAQTTPDIVFSNVTRSPANSNITISFKSPDPGTCTTVFDSQKQYSGYISLPPYTLAPIQQNYSINTFFWFIEAREQPESAPLTVWLNGGPGSSSMIGLFEESGPCEIVQMSDGSYGTQARVWGWDRSSNMLYVDQPNLVGLSYDDVTPASQDLLTGSFNYPPGDVPAGQPSWSYINGSFGSGNNYATANTTEIAAHAIWHFLQAFLGTFPQYNPGVGSNSSSVEAAGINLFAESYGGQYGPTFARLFEDQNAKRNNGTISSADTLEIKLTSLGIINGFIDIMIQAPYYASFGNNNTYDIQLFDTTDKLNLLYAFNKPNGCSAQIKACRNVSSICDPEGEGDVTSVNEACSSAVTACNSLQATYSKSGRSVYDIRQELPDVIPSGDYVEYLNYASVQKSIGARINYTESNLNVQKGFITTGDSIRGNQLEDLAYLLENGVRVAIINGDADYVSNWLGGEAVSLQLAASVPAYASAFQAAGYADIIVNNSYVGGAVRQFSNLSFSRIYDAGHMVPAYQPETAFTLFTRIIEGMDLGTGKAITDVNTFYTHGSKNATHTNDVTSSTASPTCWIRKINDSCSSDQIEEIKDGKGVVLNGMWFEDDDDFDPPATSVLAGKPGTPLPSASISASVVTAKGSTGGVESSTVVPTGVYVATATPTSTGAAKPQVTRFAGAGVAAVVALAAGLVL